MVETISAAEANRQFSKILRAVEAGESFTVTSHGRPVAQIRPVGDDDEAARLARRAALKRKLGALEQTPAVDAGKWTREELYER